MAIKSVYVDGWTASEHKKISNIDELVIEMIQVEGTAAWRDFSSQEEIVDCVRAVIDTMRLYVSHEEMDQALSTLPKKVQIIVDSAAR